MISGKSLRPLRPHSCTKSTPEQASRSTKRGGGRSGSREHAASATSASTKQEPPRVAPLLLPLIAPLLDLAQQIVVDRLRRAAGRQHLVGGRARRGGVARARAGPRRQEPRLAVRRILGDELRELVARGVELAARDQL